MQSLIQDINKSGKKYTLAITGGGTEGIGELLSHGGSSATCLEVVVPYNQKSLQDFLKYVPSKACSSETARKMALRAFQRSLKLGATPDEAVGFGITCSLARGPAEGEIRADGSHREHWVHIAFQDRRTTWYYSFDLTKSGMSREEEESECADLVVNMVWLYLCGRNWDTFNANIRWPFTDDGNMSEPPMELEKLMCGALNIARALGGKRGTLERITEFDGKPYSRDISKFIYPGSFNPIHSGHIDIAKLGMEKTGEKVTFEIAIENPDKPPLDYIDMERRFCDISSECSINKIDFENIIYTRYPLFKDKMMALPAHTFMMGADTAIRFCNEKYGRVVYSLMDLDKSGCRIIITERQGYDLTEVKTILACHNVDFISESEYKDDGVSSSKIRNKTNGSIN